MNLRCITLVLVTILFMPSASLGAGYYLPGRGVRAFSRAGAFVVGADDLTAAWYNPAQLAGLKGTRLHLDFAAVNYSMKFQRYPVAEVDELFAPVENQGYPSPGLSLALSSDFGLDDFVFALGFFTPYGTWSEFPESGAQRYSITNAQNLAFYLEASAAWQPVAGLRIGAGFTLFTVEVNEAHAVSTFPGIFGAPEDRDLDGMIQLLAKDSFVPGAVGGIWIAPGAWIPILEGFELGFSLVPPMDIHAEGNLRVRIPSHIYYDNVTMDPEEPPISIDFKLPWVVRAGIRYVGPGGLFDVEGNVVWEGWSRMEEIDIVLAEPAYYRDVPTIGDYRLVTRPLPRHYRDTLSYRLGGSYRPLDWLVVRAGFSYEDGAPPDAYYTVATPDSNKFILGLGAGVVLGAFEIDAGYMHVFQMERDIPGQASLAVQTNPSNPEGVTSVGGGWYESSYDVVGLSLMIRLDEFWK